MRAGGRGAFGACAVVVPALAWLLAALAPASAGAYDFLLPSSRGAAMGGAMAASSDDAFALWYNPALIACVDEHRVGLDYGLLDPRIRAEVEQYGSLGKIPSLRFSDAQGQWSQELSRAAIDRAFGEDAIPEMLHGFSLHMLFPIHRIIRKLPVRVGLAGTLFVPCGGTCVVKVQAHTPDQPFFPIMGSRTQRLRLMLGLGLELIRNWWTIGLSVSAFTSMTGEVSSKTPVSTYDPDRPEENQPEASTATFKQELGTTVTPMIGTVVTPLKQLRIGAYYRFAEKLDMDFDVNAGVSLNVGYAIESEMIYFLESDFFYVPAAVGLALAATPIKSLHIAVQADYVFWSDVTDTMSVSHFDVEPEALNESGGLETMEEYGNFRVRSLPPPRIKVRDIITPKIGVEYSPIRLLKIRLGYSYTPSALEPDQEYENMLLDNSYHTVGLGLGFAFYLKSKALETPFLHLDLSGQFLILQPRYNKVGVNDPEGGYHARGVVRTSGYLWGLGSQFTFRF
jgi:long-subunit fatty acid transport protein